MIIDFPDYSSGNPWQIKTIQTSSPMSVKRTNVFKNEACQFFHISWEDCLILNCKTEQDFSQALDRIDTFLNVQSKISKIIWTIHNQNSHYLTNRSAETTLRDLLINYSSIIFVMSDKHRFIVPSEHQYKVITLPHYMERSIYESIEKNKKPTFFRYGVDRNELYGDVYQKILNNKAVNKFVSDARLNHELQDEENVIVKRRFTLHEANLYARIANFGMYYRESKFNSGVINFMISNKLIIFHDKNSTKFMDLPDCLDSFCIDPSKFSTDNFDFYISLQDLSSNELDDYIASRAPDKISNSFWNSIMKI